MTVTVAVSHGRESVSASGDPLWSRGGTKQHSVFVFQRPTVDHLFDDRAFHCPSLRETSHRTAALVAVGALPLVAMLGPPALLLPWPLARQA